MYILEISMYCNTNTSAVFFIYQQFCIWQFRACFWHHYGNECSMHVTLSVEVGPETKKTDREIKKGLPKVHWVQNIHHIRAGELALNQVSWHRVTWALLMIWISCRSHKGPECLWSIIPLGTRVKGRFLPGRICCTHTNRQWRVMHYDTLYIMVNISSPTTNIINSHVT